MATGCRWQRRARDPRRTVKSLCDTRGVNLNVSDRHLKLAVISDLHADLPALDDALVQVRRLECDALVCAGDLLDGGVFPDEVIARLVAERIPTIRGNHDRWALERSRGHQSPEMFGGGWDLAPASLDFLHSLPTKLMLDLEGALVAVHHARPDSDMDGIYADLISPGELDRLLGLAGADILVVGHTHIPFALRGPDGGLVVNPGTLWRGQEDAATFAMIDADGKAEERRWAGGGTFGVLHLPEREFRVHRASDGTKLEVPLTTAGVSRSLK